MFPHLLVTLCVHLTYTVAMQFYFSKLRIAALSTGVAAMSALAQVWVWGTEKSIWGWPRVEMPEASSYSWLRFLQSY